MRQQLDVASGLEIDKATLWFMEDAVNDVTFFSVILQITMPWKNQKSKIKDIFIGRCWFEKEKWQ